MSDQNWRIEQNAEDYFGNRQKQGNIDTRRPSIRKPSDLVGPGIAPQATRITDFNDLLATYNGFFSAAEDAFAAPNGDEAFIGYTSADALLGGKQVFTGLESGAEYTRVFIRNPMDPSSISWGQWSTPEFIPASMSGISYQSTSITSSPAFVDLNMPSSMDEYGDTNTYGLGATSLSILRPGVYTGTITVVPFATFTPDSLTLQLPRATSPNQISTEPTFTAFRAMWLPFTFTAEDNTEVIKVTIQQQSGSTRVVNITNIDVVRVGGV